MVIVALQDKSGVTGRLKKGLPQYKPSVNDQYFAGNIVGHG
jgi:hypothetical protein